MWTTLANKNYFYSKVSIRLNLGNDYRGSDYYFQLYRALSWKHMRMYPKVSGLAAWSENCKWYSSVPLGAIVSLFCELV